MLPILGLFGAALAAALWPETASDTQDDESAETRMETLGTDETNVSDILSYATSEEDSLSITDGGSVHQTIAGTDAADVLFGKDGTDHLYGGTGADLLDGSDGQDFVFGDDDTDGDELIGGDGHDQIFMGDGDRAEGGRGDDVFHMEDHGTAYIDDYNPDDDRLLVYYDPHGPAPDLKATSTETGVLLQSGSHVVAVLAGVKDFDLSQVHVLPDRG